uniref:4a-hydroxytetrahydrobiopterin dehydratase n=1 Tax=Leersia perrieri TaxID=77586 RepID=A0A0D9V3T8_9ORYZ
MIRPAVAHARLLLARSYAMAASGWPGVSKNLPLLGHGRSHCLTRQDETKISSRRWCHAAPAGNGTVSQLNISTAAAGSSLGATAVGMSSSTAKVAHAELAKKSCVPCNSKDIHAMSEDSAKKLLEQVGGWQLATEGDILKLHRVWKVKNFVKGLEFFQLVSAIAEEEGHHPDLHLVGWNNVKIDVWTHSVRGLTDNDFILAAKINNLNLEGLLSKKATSKKDAL